MFSEALACFSGTVILTALWARPVNLKDFFMLYNLYQTALLNTKQNRSAAVEYCLLQYQLTGLTMKTPNPKGIIPSPGFPTTLKHSIMNNEKPLFHFPLDLIFTMLLAKLKWWQHCVVHDAALASSLMIKRFCRLRHKSSQKGKNLWLAWQANIALYVMLPWLFLRWLKGSADSDINHHQRRTKTYDFPDWLMEFGPDLPGVFLFLFF